MKKRDFSVTLLKEKDGSIRKCRIDEIDREGNEFPRLRSLSKREVEYLIWIMADARNNMKYTRESPRLFADLEVDKLIVKIDKDLELEGCPPPEL